MTRGMVFAYSRGVHFFRAGAISVALFAGIAAPADDPSPDSAASEVVELERLRVTGTRIRRTDIEGALPVTVIDRETIDLSGESSLADFVRSLSFNTHGSYRSQTDGYGHGSAQISLRGLGSERSLVLVDGRRLPKSPISTSYQDLNTIPMGSVERIEVLTDGASAIYGSDAIGGVVNIITRDDYDGWELMYGRAKTDSGGGDRDYGSVMFGTFGTEWKLIATYSWNERNITLNRDFGWYEPAEIDPFANNFTTVDPATGYPLFNFTAIPGGCSDSPAFSLISYPDSLSGELCIYDANYEVGNETSVGTEGLLMKFEYDLSARWTVWLSASASATDAYGQRDPAAATSLGGTPLPENSPNNPTNPASIMHEPAFGPNVPVNYWHRFDSLGPNNTDVKTTLEDLEFGLTGWLNNVELDAGIRFTRNATEDLTGNILQWEQAHALIVSGAYDLQHPRGNPADVLQAMKRNHQWWFDYDQNELLATAAVDWLEIEGRSVQWVIGGEYREESSDAESTHEGFGGPKSTARDVIAVYFESLLPLTSDLELSLAGRYDDYTDWGDKFSPKVSLRWRVFDQLLLRASYGGGFRAPELALSARGTFEGWDVTHDDPQSCEVIGLPPGCEVPFYGTDSVSPGLGAEQSEQYSVGLVWQPHEPFSLVVDYYRIEIENKIQWLWPDLVIIRDRLGAPLPPDMGVERDPVTGLLLAVTHGTGNFGFVETSGIDLTLDLNISIGPGRWNSHFLGTYMIEDVWDGWNALAYGGVPDFRATLSNSYAISDFTMTWNVHYVSAYDQGFAGGEDDAPSWTTHDLQIAWNTPWNGTLALGARNAFNEQPPLDVGITGGSRYNTALYDAFGRITYVRYTQTF